MSTRAHSPKILPKFAIITEMHISEQSAQNSTPLLVGDIWRPSGGCQKLWVAGSPIYTMLFHVHLL